MEIKLVITKIEKDKDGFPKKIKKLIRVFAEEKSVARTEAYESMKAGVNVKTVYEIRQEDWEYAKKLADRRCIEKIIGCDEQEYKIVRTYKVGKAKIEVVCG